MRGICCECQSKHPVNRGGRTFGSYVMAERRGVGTVPQALIAVPNKH